MALAQGVIVKVRGIVISVDNVAGTASVRLVDDNNQPITPPVTLNQALLEVVEVAVAVGDVLEEIDSGVTAVVRWVNPANAMQWSPSATGSPTRPTTGWKKVGTFTPSP